MKVDLAEATEARFKEKSALNAFRRLMNEAEEAGFEPRYKRSVVKAVEFVREDDYKPYSAVPANGHFLFYLRQPLLRRFKDMFEQAERRFGPGKPNRLEEYRLKIRDEAELEAALGWLREQGAWPR